jgi:hypothetical protein
MSSDFKVIHDSERVDFENIVRQSDYALDDFELAEIPRAPDSGDIIPIAGEVVIRRISRNISRSYQAGHSFAWVAAFAADLKEGKFQLK